MNRGACEKNVEVLREASLLEFDVCHSRSARGEEARRIKLQQQIQHGDSSVRGAAHQHGFLMFADMKGFEKYVGSRVDGWFLADTGVQWLHNPTPIVEGSTRVNEFEYVFICMPKFKHNPNGLPLTETIQLLPTNIEDKINSNINLNPQWIT